MYTLDGLVSNLEDISEELEEIIGRIRVAESALSNVGSADAERLRQVRAQLEKALTDDHEWVGGSMYTLRGVIDGLE